MPVRLRFRWLLIGLLLSVAGGCEARPKDNALHGQITSIYAEHAVLIVKHDDIQGFMPAMTMPYDVTDPSLITGLVAGDIIDATLNVYGPEFPSSRRSRASVTRRSTWIRHDRSWMFCSRAMSFPTTRCRIYTAGRGGSPTGGTRQSPSRSCTRGVQCPTSVR